jgi:ADP-heptose:LPS heptosyltransferase
MRIIMDLMPDEAEIGEEIVRLSKGNVTLLALIPNFQRYKAVLERMNVLITTDTGPMHIAGAVGTRLVALFGITRPESSGAHVPHDRWIVLQSPSRQIADISPKQVFEAARSFLPKTNPNRLYCF